MINKENLYIGKKIIFEYCEDLIREIHNDYVLLDGEPDDFKVNFQEIFEIDEKQEDNI